MSMMTVATFNEKEKAETIKGRLEQAGIPAEVYDESKLQRFWFWSKPLAGEKVRVEEKDFEIAKSLLKGQEVEEDMKDAIRCPQCGASQIEYPQFTRKFMTTTLVEIFCATKLLPKEFYCQSCQFTWPSKFEAPPADWGSEEIDTLGWKRKKE